MLPKVALEAVVADRTAEPKTPCSLKVQRTNHMRTQDNPGEERRWNGGGGDLTACFWPVLSIISYST